jgi:hypothetical protein
MVGFDRIVPGHARDHLVPALGLVFAAACLAVGVARGGSLGGLLSIALLLGSPLPLWLLRGCYAESVGAILVALAVLSWVVQPAGRRQGNGFVGAALGLAVSFHPVMLALSVPALGIMLVEADEGIGLSLRRWLGFGLGLLPLVVSTLFIAQPYGRLDLRYQLFHARVSASVRITLVAAVLAGVALLAVMPSRRRFIAWLGRIHSRRPAAVSLGLLLFWVVPVVVAMFCWRQGEDVRRGLNEMGLALQVPFGVLLCALCLGTLMSRSAGKEKAVLTIGFAVLPVFLYLKGAEQMALWSQRRLLPPLLLWIVACLPAAAGWLAGARRGRLRLLLCMGSAALLCVAGGYNLVRWPAPYLVRYEKGADAWTARLEDRIGGRLAVFDYHPFGVPFAAGGVARVLGLSEFGESGMKDVGAWLAQRAKEEEILWVTAYASPGMEEGVVLDSAGRESVCIERVRSKAALPALRQERVVEVELLRARPVSDGGSAAMDKVLDGGPLGLRGRWSRQDIPITMPDGSRAVARWSRQGSGIVGPVPPSGSAVRIRIEATTGRRSGPGSQVLVVRPPWDGPPLRLTVSNAFTCVEGVTARPDGSSNRVDRTGVYRIESETPYSPLVDGIKGYPTDLGALIHRIRIADCGSACQAASGSDTAYSHHAAPE